MSDLPQSDPSADDDSAVGEDLSEEQVWNEFDQEDFGETADAQDDLEDDLEDSDEIPSTGASDPEDTPTPSDTRQTNSDASSTEGDSQEDLAQRLRSEHGRHAATQRKLRTLQREKERLEAMLKAPKIDKSKLREQADDYGDVLGHIPEVLEQVVDRVEAATASRTAEDVQGDIDEIIAQEQDYVLQAVPQAQTLLQDIRQNPKVYDDWLENHAPSRLARISAANQQNIVDGKGVSELLSQWQAYRSASSGGARNPAPKSQSARRDLQRDGARTASSRRAKVDDDMAGAGSEDYYWDMFDKEDGLK